MSNTGRQLYIAGNWKMHKTISEAQSLARSVAKSLADTPHRIMVAPAFTALSAVSKALAATNIVLAAQNMASAESGAHTGEISPLMLKDAGADTVILGHSERRAVYGESDELINVKVKLALQHDFEVILCVGETIEEREAGNADSVVERQLRIGLTGIKVSAMKSVVIAYEPVWAIGTGKTATPEDANAMHEFIRSSIGSWYSQSIAEGLIIQYGGSVKPENAESLLGQTHIDGALVGGASLEADSFAAIARAHK